jgi:membrane protease YdiL (CAAX protease family)
LRPDRRRSPLAESGRLAGRGQDPAITFLLLLPLGLLHLSSPRPHDSGAWSLIEHALQPLGGWAPPLLGLALLLGFLWALGRVRNRRLAWRTGSLVGVLEGVAWGCALGPSLRLATGLLPLDDAPLQLGDAHADLALAAGAGLYEELIFRALLVGAGGLLLESTILLLGWRGLARPLGFGLALAAASLIFAWAHVLGDARALAPEVFAFRALAGLAFGGMFLLRGLAVAAWGHASYDALLLLA